MKNDIMLLAVSLLATAQLAVAYVNVYSVCPGYSFSGTPYEYLQVQDVYNGTVAAKGIAYCDTAGALCSQLDFKDPSDPKGLFMYARDIFSSVDQAGALQNIETGFGAAFKQYVAELACVELLT